MKRILFVSLLIVSIFSSNLKKENLLDDSMFSDEEPEVRFYTSELLFKTMIPIFSHGFGNQPNEAVCSICQRGMKAIKTLIESKGMELLYKIATAICKMGIMEKEICPGLINNYFKNFADALLTDIDDLDKYCGILNLCEDKNVYLNHEEYAKDLLKDKPQKQREEPDLSKKPLRILQVADIHYDKYYLEGATVECKSTICCRTLPTEKEIKKGVPLAGKYGSIGICDINKLMIDSAIQEMYELNPDFMIFTGDFCPHDIWQGSQEIIESLIVAIRDGIKEKFGRYIQIYPTLGNHEKFPVDMYTHNETAMLEGIANTYKEFLHPDAYESFKKYGYYTMKHPGSNLRIVSLNCFACDNFDFHLFNSKKEAQNMFAWLENVLREAEKNGEYVYLLNHIPLNEETFLNECAYRLIAIIDRFNYIIRGHFSGHTHNDDIITVREYFNRDKVIHLNFVAPSLTTYRGHFPELRIYLADPSTMLITDYEQYFFNVTKANLEEGTKWELGYKAAEFFGVKDLTKMEDISKFDNIPEYLIHRFSFTPKGYEVGQNEKEQRKAKCTITTDNFPSYMNCAHPKFEVKDIKAWFFVALNLIQGKWKAEKLDSHIN
ncbi:MAG: PPN1 endopolyphosphatase family protein [archaeon]|nr:PPN1 endopolyphosphatase family protein [archaeon]